MFRYFHPVTRRCSPGTVPHKTQQQEKKRQGVKRQTTLLLLADDALLPHLSRLLSEHGFAIYATSELKLARAILSIAPIDLILYHPIPDLGYGGWETYTHLRQVTLKPVLAVANLTTAHFQQPPHAIDAHDVNTDLANYVHLINFLCHPPTGW